MAWGQWFGTTGEGASAILDAMRVPLAPAWLAASAAHDLGLPVR